MAMALESGANGMNLAKLVENPMAHGWLEGAKAVDIKKESLHEQLSRNKALLKTFLAGNGLSDDKVGEIIDKVSQSTAPDPKLFAEVSYYATY